MKFVKITYTLPFSNETHIEWHPIIRDIALKRRMELEEHVYDMYDPKRCGSMTTEYVDVPTKRSEDLMNWLNANLNRQYI